MLQSMKDNINYEAPEDWGVSSKDAWVSFEELKDNGAPVLEGRDVVSFAVATLKNQPAHGNRKQPAQVKKCDPGFKAQGSNCVPSTTSGKNQGQASAQRSSSDQPSPELKRKGDEIIKQLQKEKRLCVLCAFAVHFVAPTAHNPQRADHPTIY